MRIYVVTAVRNGQETIVDACQSVLDQLGDNDRYIVIDGASTDKTGEHVQQFAPSFGDRLLYVSEPDTGIYNAMNKGIRQALETADDDDLIALLNADDYYLSGALAAVCEVAAQRPQVDFFYGDTTLRSSCSELTWKACLEGMPLEHPTMFVRAKVYRECGLYDESYRIAADYEFVLRVVGAGLTGVYLNQAMVFFREGGVSTTAIEESFKEAIRARIQHGASPLYEHARYKKQKLFEGVYPLASMLPGVSALYERHKRSR
jgi:glycosyltransferase involved in cell wall biosynthesis